MATTKSFQLYINDENVKQYFSTSGGALNGASIGGKYITMRTSSTTATFTMNDAGRDVLFPSAAAIAHKVDVWAQTIATLNNSKNTINVAIAGQNAITTERIHTSLTEHTGSVSGSFTKSSTSAVYVVKIVNGFHAAGVRDTSITAYFTQYSCAANKVGNGVKSISVSNAEPYEGETVTFSAELYNGASFDGWYSDEACTQLVSSNLTHSTTAAADLTLYAKATIDADIYNCSAVAGENIVSASVSDDSVIAGDSVTFTAQLNGHCTFDGWYSDSNYATLISTANPYTTTITSNTTLYAKGTKISYSVRVGIAEHGTATVSANTAHYGDSVTFTFTPENNTWELYGWYSDEGFTQLVSESNPYTYSVTGNVTLYPKVDKKRYKITFQTARNANTIDMKVAVLDFDALNRTERRYLKVGNYEAIEQSKVLDIKSASISSLIGKILTVEILCPLGMTVAFWGTDTRNNDNYICYIDDANNNALTSWPYYWYQPSEDATFKLDKGEGACDCYAVGKDVIFYADATSPTRQGFNAIFEAEVPSGYIFSGWYSDAACTTLVSTDNPAYVKTPVYTTEYPSSTSLTLYAKTTEIGTGTGLYVKQNGTFIEANAVYKKVNGAWVSDVDSCKTLLSSTERTCTIVKRI